MPECIVETNDGVVLIANGIDAVLRWDGYASQASIAGVAPPYVDYLVAQSDVTSAEQPVLAGSGLGALTGTYAIAVRFVDENGNYSDLSNFSEQVEVSGVAQFDFTNLPVPSQPSVVRRQILRNTDGQQDTFYVDIDTTDLGSTSLSSTRDDDDLATQEAVSLFSTAGGDIVNIWAPPPSYKPFLAWHQQKMYYYGIQEYTDGSARVQNGSTTVQGLNTRWKVTLTNRVLYLDGASQPYQIETVDEVAQTLTLTEPYIGPEIRYATYSIKPQPDENDLFYWSETDEPEAVPRINAFRVPKDGDMPTGMMNYQSFLFFLKRRRMYRLTTKIDPLVDGNVYMGMNRGCINNRCWVIANETAYLLDEGGVYAFMGDQEGRPVSPPIQDIFRRDELTIYTINWSAAKNFHASHSPQEEVIRWFVCIGGDSLPRHALAYCYTTERWWIEEYQHPVGSSCLGRTAGVGGTSAVGQETVYLGSYGNKIYAMTPNGLDGVVTAKATRALVEDSTTWTVTAKNVVMPNLAGATIGIVEGRAKGQTRRVVEISDRVIRVDRPWDIRPDENDVFQLGAVPIVYETRRLRLARSETQVQRNCELNFVPVKMLKEPLTQKIQFKIYDDYRNVAKLGGRTQDAGVSARVQGKEGEEGVAVSLDSSGYQLVNFPGGFEGSTDAPRAYAIGLDGHAGPSRVRVQTLLLNGVSR